MKITKKTKVKDVLPLLINSDRMERFLEIIEPVELECPIISMSLGQFGDLMLNEEKFIEKLLKPNRKAILAFGQLKKFKIEMENIGKFFEKHQLKQSEDEKMASRGVDFVNPIASMLISCVEFFNLHSFREAEQIQLCDYMIVLQNQCANAKFQRNYSKIIEQKSKMKSHGKNR